MANEISIRSSLVVANGNLQYKSVPAAFFAGQTTRNGPTPGAVTVTTGGTTIGLSSLTTPGVFRVTNTDPTNFVTLGIYDGTTFRPFAEILPGESYIMRLSRTVLTANAAADVVKMKADTASVVVLFECFDA